MNKVELETKGDSFTDEINFMKALYEAVSVIFHVSPQLALLQARSPTSSSTSPFPSSKAYLTRLLLRGHV